MRQPQEPLFVLELHRAEEFEKKGKLQEAYNLYATAQLAIERSVPPGQMFPTTTLEKMIEIKMTQEKYVDATEIMERVMKNNPSRKNLQALQGLYDKLGTNQNATAFAEKLRRQKASHR